MSKKKKVYIIVLGNIYRQGYHEVQSVCSSLEEARSHLKLIENKDGGSEYDEEDMVAYSKEQCYFIKKFILNKPPDWL